MKKILPIIILFLCNCSFGQQITYSKVYHEDDDIEVKSVAPTAENGVLFIGNYYNLDGFAICLDSLGDQLWTKQYSFLNSIAYNTRFNSVINTSDSAYLITGSVHNYVTDEFDVFCMKINSLGDTLWTKSFGFTIPNSGDSKAVIETIDSTYVITGTIGNGDALFIAKLSSTGNLIWSTQLDEIPLCSIRSIKQSTDSSFYLTGYSGSNALLINISENGQFNWAKTYVGQDAIDLEIQSDGIVMLISDLSTQKLGLMKCDYSGTFLWGKLYNMHYYGNEPYDKANLMQLSDNSLIITMGTQYDGELLKVDSSGNQLTGLNLRLNTQEVVEMEDHGFLIAGNGPLYGIKSLNQNTHIGLIKMDSTLNGNSTFCADFQTFSSDTLSMIVGTNVTFTTTTGMTTQLNPFFVYETGSYSDNGCVDQFGGINEYNSAQLIEVYPNSSSGIFNIEQLVENSTLSISVYDAFGKEILNQQLTTTSSIIDLSENAAGVYFYRVVGSDLKSATGKMIVSR